MNLTFQLTELRGGTRAMIRQERARNSHRSRGGCHACWAGRDSNFSVLWDALSGRRGGAHVAAVKQDI